MKQTTFPSVPRRTSSARAQCLVVCESVALLFFSREARNPDFYVQYFLVLATDSDLIFLFYFILVWFFKTWPLFVDQTVLECLIWIFKKYFASQNL